MKFKLYIIVSIFAIISCNTQSQINKSQITTEINSHKNKGTLTKDDLKKWYIKDIILDTIPGISWDKFCNELLKYQNNEPVTAVVAVIDSEIAINDSIFSNRIWTNTEEIPDNGIDDDNNSYIDDIHGWNFLGNPKGENIINANFEYVRIVRTFDQKFERKNINQVAIADTVYFNYYKKAKIRLAYELKKAQKSFSHSDKLFKKYVAAKNALKEYFPDAIYDIETLNTIDTINNNLGSHVKEIHEVIKYKETDEMINRVHQNYLNDIEKRINLNFNERTITGDNLNDLTDVGYGNNQLSNNTNLYTHGTRVASTILSETETQKINIMPVCISPYGDEQDKDIALAIRYAVDNGAKVINMSFGKEFSLHRNWVFDAFKYADQHDVLIVSSAGNSGFNLSKHNNYYPNDNVDNGTEVSNNFVLVGVSTPYANEKLMASYSNYGKHDVDLFAPGDDMKTYYPNNELKDDGGTSLSAGIVTKIAALLFSYYPNLKASEVKDILLKSSVKYKFDIQLKQENDSIKSVPFSELSKSGGVVNAYNALLMAAEVSKSKK